PERASVVEGHPGLRPFGLVAMRLAERPSYGDRTRFHPEHLQFEAGDDVRLPLLRNATVAARRHGFARRDQERATEHPVNAAEKHRREAHAGTKQMSQRWHARR